MPTSSFLRACWIGFALGVLGTGFVSEQQFPPPDLPPVPGFALLDHFAFILSACKLTVIWTLTSMPFSYDSRPEKPSTGTSPFCPNVIYHHLTHPPREVIHTS